MRNSSSINEVFLLYIAVTLEKIEPSSEDENILSQRRKNARVMYFVCLKSFISTTAAIIHYNITNCLLKIILYVILTSKMHLVKKLKMAFYSVCSYVITVSVLM